jgi:hypothetical protein
MTTTHRVRAGIIAVTVLLIAAAYVLLTTRPIQARSLSLAFERYSTDSDLYVQDVAFLWLTNSSDRTYYLGTGGANTLLPDTLIAFGRYERQNSQSYMVNCEFSDQTNTMQQRHSFRADRRGISWVSFASWGQSVELAPNSAVRLRVALPPKGQKRRVAVLCAELPAGPARFWTNSIGLSILRTLPRPIARKVLRSELTVLRVWCDRELSHPGDGIPKR